MNTCSIVGMVKKAKMDTTKKGKPFAKVRVEVSRSWQDQVFTTRFDVVVYGQDATTAGALSEGTLVWASGEIGAYANEYQGKTYANLQLTGRIGTISKPDFNKVRQEAENSQQSLPMPRSAAPATPAPAEPPVEDDVPF